jgi:ferredoxin-nitrite reductase
LNVFVEIYQVTAAVLELIRIFRDHGSRDARSKCRFAFLVEKWGTQKLRAELTARMGYELPFQGRDMRGSHHADYIGVTPQKQKGLAAVGLCVPTGRVNSDQLDELGRLADVYGNGELRLTTGQNAVLVNVAADLVPKLLNEPLLKQFSPWPSPFVRGLVACVGTDYCNLALIETKSRAVALSRALHERIGAGVNPLTIHWSGCPAGCGNHEAADIGLRGFKTRIDGKLVDAVAVYVGGRTGAHAIAGKEIMASVQCDESLPAVVADLIQSSQIEEEREWQRPTNDPLFIAASTAGLATWRRSSTSTLSTSAVTG